MVSGFRCRVSAIDDQWSEDRQRKSEVVKTEVGKKRIERLGQRAWLEKRTSKEGILSIYTKYKGWE